MLQHEAKFVDVDRITWANGNRTPTVLIVKAVPISRDWAYPGYKMYTAPSGPAAPQPCQGHEAELNLLGTQSYQTAVRCENFWDSEAPVYNSPLLLASARAARDTTSYQVSELAPLDLGDHSSPEGLTFTPELLEEPNLTFSTLTSGMMLIEPPIGYSSCSDNESSNYSTSSTYELDSDEAPSEPSSRSHSDDEGEKSHYEEEKKPKKNSRRGDLSSELTKLLYWSRKLHSCRTTKETPPPAYTRAGDPHSFRPNMKGFKCRKYNLRSEGSPTSKAERKALLKAAEVGL